MPDLCMTEEDQKAMEYLEEVGWTTPWPNVDPKVKALARLAVAREHEKLLGIAVMLKMMHNKEEAPSNLAPWSSKS